MPPKKRSEISNADKEKRKQFALWFHSTPNCAENIIWSDESKMSISPDNCYLWRKRGSNAENIFMDYKKFYDSLMVFGAIGYNFKSPLVICPVSIDSEQYCANLMEAKIDQLPDGRFFQQDG